MEPMESAASAIEHSQDCTADRRRLRDQGAMFMSSTSRSTAGTAAQLGARSWTMGMGRSPPAQRPRRNTAIRDGHHTEEVTSSRGSAEQQLDDQVRRVQAARATAAGSEELAASADIMMQERSRTRGRRRLQDQGAMLVASNGRTAVTVTSPSSSSQTGSRQSHDRRADGEASQEAHMRASPEVPHDADDQASLRSLRDRVQRIQTRISELDPMDGDSEERPSSAVLRAQGLHRQIQDLRRQVEELQQVEHATRRSGNRVGVGEAMAEHRTEATGRPTGGFFAHLQGGARRLARRRADTATSMSSQEDASLLDEDGAAEVHPFVGCDGCGASPPLYGRVMTCEDCADFDLCAGCYRDRNHWHPRSHRFRPRRAPAQGGLAAALFGILGDHQMLEDAMLLEALRRSADGAGSEGGRSAPSQEDLELRAVEVLSKLPRVHYGSAQKGEQLCTDCALCLEEYTAGEVVLRLPCKHVFHEGCIGPWLVKSLTCPLCQTQIS
mmetsp:Transcript_31360/g.57550  ORF Transcript_31360/g.57550 Transcript_31360/m.57550 type:complete len:497 (-) Transcript_31360:72-1562(-)